MANLLSRVIGGRIGGQQAQAIIQVQEAHMLTLDTDLRQQYERCNAMTQQYHNIADSNLVNNVRIRIGEAYGGHTFAPVDSLEELKYIPREDAMVLRSMPPIAEKFNNKVIDGFSESFTASELYNAQQASIDGLNIDGTYYKSTTTRTSRKLEPKEKLRIARALKLMQGGFDEHVDATSRRGNSY